MESCRFHIAIIETSQIIYEGLHAALFNSHAECKITRVDSLEELVKAMTAEKIEIVIINPQHIQNRLKEVKKIRKQFPAVLFIGIVTTLLEKEIQMAYNATYSIYDATEQIISGLCRMVEHTHTTERSNEDETLSERETEVLILLLKGYANKEIGESLNISIHTVVTHRKNITLKTGIRSQSGLTIYAISKKIVSIDDFL